MNGECSDTGRDWGHVLNAQFAARLARQAERRRWRAVLSQYMTPERLKQVMEQVLDEAELPHWEQGEEASD